MPHCPFCKKLLERDGFSKHIEGHLELELMAHPETPDECEQLKPLSDEGAESEDEL